MQIQDFVNADPNIGSQNLCKNTVLQHTTVDTNYIRVLENLFFAGGGSRVGGLQGHAPSSSGSKFLHFHAVFRENWSNRWLAQFYGLSPPLGNPGSITGICIWIRLPSFFCFHELLWCNMLFALLTIWLFLKRHQVWQRNRQKSYAASVPSVECGLCEWVRKVFFLLHENTEALYTLVKYSIGSRIWSREEAEFFSEILLT